MCKDNDKWYIAVFLIWWVAHIDLFGNCTMFFVNFWTLDFRVLFKMVFIKVALVLSSYNITVLRDCSFIFVFFGKSSTVLATGGRQRCSLIMISHHTTSQLFILVKVFIFQSSLSFLSFSLARSGLKIGYFDSI